MKPLCEMIAAFQRKYPEVVFHTYTAIADMPLIIAKRQSVRNLLENWFGDVADKIRVMSTFNLSHNNESMMVESGVGLALVMEFTCNSGKLCLRPLEPEIASGCVLVWKKNQTLSLVMTRFIDYVKQIRKEYGTWNIQH